mmetsp:Transcript_5566/g.14118  ORF Transcript_5566/g.14118 Transcript_5566/m.14118 type:complete len:280 (-) Transcript_5566:302-1141(-)
MACGFSPTRVAGSRLSLSLSVRIISGARAPSQSRTFVFLNFFSPLPIFFPKLVSFSFFCWHTPWHTPHTATHTPPSHRHTVASDSRSSATTAAAAVAIAAAASAAAAVTVRTHHTAPRRRLTSLTAPPPHTHLPSRPRLTSSRSIATHLWQRSGVSGVVGDGFAALEVIDVQAPHQHNGVHHVYRIRRQEDVPVQVDQLEAVERHAEVVHSEHASEDEDGGPQLLGAHHLVPAARGQHAQPRQAQAQEDVEHVGPHGVGHCHVALAVLRDGDGGQRVGH